MKKILLYAVGFLLVLLVAAGVALAIVYNSWTNGVLPQHSGELQVKGLKDRVEIIRDKRGVPHIYASNSYDLFFAQGYTQAQDRWWQMEFSRRIGRGEIQELTGKSKALIGTDIFIRQVGWRKAAETDVALLSDEARSILQAFADGVNAYITGRPAAQLAFEYNVLGLTGVTIPIQAWTIADTLVWGKVMAWDLSGNQSGERFRTNLVKNFGEEMLAEFAPDYDYDSKITVLPAEDFPAEGEPLPAKPLTNARINASGNLAGNFDDHVSFAFGRGEGIGSNNWVVSGSKTASGMPLLANDPHLGIRMPSIWYEIGLHCQPVNEACPYNVRGFTFSLTPGIVVGHNERIAWGVTNYGWDTQDLYAIEVNPDNPLQYKFNGEWLDMTTREEVIRFGNRKDETLTITVRETRFGPIINDNQLDDDGNVLGFNNENPLALRWTANEPGTLFESVLLLNRAQNWEEFRTALSYWDTPSQNFVYADVDGNIGYQVPGLMPVRAAGHLGLFPVDGTTDKYDWRGYIPFEYLPSVFNPERGYIASANQAPVPRSYYEQLRLALADQFGEDASYIFGYEWANGYRGQRIVDMLEATDKHTFETFQAIQGDNEFMFARAIAPTLSAVDMGSETLNEARTWMLNWDYQMHMNSQQAALFGMFFKHLLDKTFNDELAVFDSFAFGSGINMRSIELLVEKPESAWWDNITTEGTTERRDDILRAAFKAAYEATVARLGSDRSKWKWGDIHTATFISSPLGESGIDLIENVVNRGKYPTSGGAEIVNATGWYISTLEVRALPSLRMVIDFADFTQNKGIHSTGQSGHPASPNYADYIEDWRHIRYYPMLWTREQVEANKAATLILKP